MGGRSASFATGLCASMLLAACAQGGTPSGAVVGSAESCWRGPHPSPIPGAGPPAAATPTYAGHPISVVFDGHAVDERLVAFDVNAALQNYARRRELLGGGAPRVSELDLVRDSVAALVRDDLLLCEGQRDGVAYDPAAAEAAARQQVAAYRQAVAQASAPARGVETSSSPLPGGGRLSTVQRPADQPTPPPIPGGLSPEAYYLSPFYIAVLERSQVRSGERRRIEAAHPELSSSRALADWMRQVIGRYSVSVSGLGDFSIPDVYESVQAAMATP